MQPLLALHVQDFSEATAVVGLGSFPRDGALAEDSLTVYNHSSEMNVDGPDVAIIYPDEVIHAAKEAHGKTQETKGPIVFQFRQVISLVLDDM